MPFAVFGSVTNCATLGVSFLHGLVFIGSTYYLPLFFQLVLGATPILSGVYLLPTAATSAIGSMSTGALIGKTGLFLPQIYFGFFMITLGYGLFIDLQADSSWAKIIIFQLVNGIGFGPLFLAPLVALQAHTSPRDIGTATAALAYIRSIGTTLGVVVGNALYSNQFSKNIAQYESLFSPQTAKQISTSPGSSTELIDHLPPTVRTDVRAAFAQSLQPLWIVYCCLAGVGLVITFFIKRKELTDEHQETETGLTAEKANAKARRAEMAAKKDGM